LAAVNVNSNGSLAATRCGWAVAGDAEPSRTTVASTADFAIARFMMHRILNMN
jgi:hypothetical protein